MTAEEELYAWEEWRRQCALGKIRPEEQQHLTGVIAQRFQRRLRKLAAAGIWLGPAPAAPEPADCAHYFESYLALHQRRDGKSYKHWLLTRGRRDLDTVQSGVMLLIRNVVKEWIRDTHPRTAPLSLQDTFGSDVSLEQCIPGAVSGEETSLRSWILEKRGVWAEDCTDAEKRMLAIRAKGWVFSSPRALAVAGMGKTTLHKLHRAVLQRWVGCVQEAHPGTSAEEAVPALLEALDETGRRFFPLLAEKLPEDAFRQIKDPE